VSADAIAVGIFSIVGTLLGVLVGLLGERYARERGKLHCEIDAWTGEERNSYGAPEVRHFEATFYNEKDVALALWEVHMEAVQEDGETDLVGLQLTSTGEWVNVLNLPPHVAISQTMKATAGGEVLYRLKHAHQLRFVGVIAGGKELIRELPSW
jgi:hypothetical protein